jgi:hypothetical protein
MVMFFVNGHFLATVEVKLECVGEYRLELQYLSLKGVGIGDPSSHNIVNQAAAKEGQNMSVLHAGYATLPCDLAGGFLDA